MFRLHANHIYFLFRTSDLEYENYKKQLDQEYMEAGATGYKAMRLKVIF